MLGAEFAVLLPTVLPLIISTLESDDGVVVKDEDDEFGAGSSESLLCDLLLPPFPQESTTFHQAK